MDDDLQLEFSADGFLPVPEFNVREPTAFDLRLAFTAHQNRPGSAL